MIKPYYARHLHKHAFVHHQHLVPPAQMPMTFMVSVPIISPGGVSELLTHRSNSSSLRNCRLDPFR